ncbi:MAG: hypothetical protein ACRBBW_05455 [Cellvibrionaceae bacterium]
MEEFKSLEELTEMDEKHRLMAVICGSVPSLERMHKYLSEEVLNDEVPDKIKGQFNVAKNMALYSYYLYALAPEVHLKTYTVIEHALRLKTNPKKKMMLKALINHAVSQRWIKDSGFRHIESPSPDNQWCKSMVDVISDLRNSQAHGSSMLVGDCLHHISSCADFVNQLFPTSQTRNGSRKKNALPHVAS